MSAARTEETPRRPTDAERLAASPRCARGEPTECGHQLAYHDPCSRCACEWFVAAEGDGA